MSARIDDARRPVLPPPGEWAARAACRNHPAVPSKAWMPDGAEQRNGTSAHEARMVCLTECPVQHECLQHGLANREAIGIYGGRDEKQREHLLKSPTGASDAP